MTWYRQLGFRHNPLDVRPNTALVGLEAAEAQLRSHIEKGEICFLNGLTGSGKTSLLLRLQKELKRHRFVYLDAHDLPKNFSLEDELSKKRGFFDRLWLRSYPRKTPVLIIDEFQATSPDLVLEARAKWEHPEKSRIRSIVIAQISKHLKNVTPSFLERLGSRIVMLNTLDSDDMRKVLRARLTRRKTDYSQKLSADAASFIIRCSGGNPRRLLEYTDEIFDFHYKKFGEKNPVLLPSYEVSYHGAREILGLDKVHVEGFDILNERHRQIKGSEKTAAQTWRGKYSGPQARVLMLLKQGPKTLSQVSKRLKVSESTAARYLGGLQRRGAVLPAGRRGKKKVWQLDPAVRREMVRV